MTNTDSGKSSIMSPSPYSQSRILREISTMKDIWTFDFMDLPKAYDYVIHERLLCKIQHYDIGDTNLTCLKDFL